MAVPEVDKKLLEELEAMGFPLARATRSLYYSGNSSLQDAVEWIIDHENDPDIDQIPLVTVNIDLDASEPFDVTEEVKLKAEKLRNGARQLQKEKEFEREREKERIRASKELQEAKQIAEDNARKRMIALREADKEEERRARERIHQKLAADKAERRSKFGIQPAVSSSVLPAPQTAHERSVSAHVTSTKKEEVLTNCLRSMRHNHKDDDARVKRAFQTLMIYVRNVLKNPDVEKYRRIRLMNPVFKERVSSLPEGVKFLELCGFERANGGQFLYLPREKVDPQMLNSAISALHSAMSNPFFGLLSTEQASSV